jgi:hypothetical protein
MKAPAKSIVLLIPIVFECIDQFNLTTAEGFVMYYLHAANATGALTAQYHSSMRSLIERLSSKLVRISAVTVSPLLTTVAYGLFFDQIPRLRSVFDSTITAHEAF